MKETWILGIRISDRFTKTVQVQNILTKFGCSIKTRLGLHELNDDTNSSAGMIILELSGDVGEFLKLENALIGIDGIEVKKMVFS